MRWRWRRPSPACWCCATPAPRSRCSRGGTCGGMRRLPGPPPRAPPDPAMPLIRAFIKAGNEHPAGHDLSSLRLLGTVGEPINPEAWVWYWKHIGSGRCPIVDTWWQTETGGIMITPLPGVTTLKPGSATLPLPGMRAAVVDEQGRDVAPGGGGYVVLTHPWPGMLRGIWGDDERYRETYWARYGDRY